ncbi:hypothetical protein [Herminiimonas contaminans]|uniref:Uncharacterized protein n=1 Tax=Herminiimonas contaminans TaxID=1111140 RepID=A0ABS0EQW6_9BURK|nr:hypothetical protein [Herminiimonas contaminans]MBF8177248.1 hypothetical protein [Herminiimonas contaminans]
MKKIIFSLLALSFACFANAQTAYYLGLQQRNPTDTGWSTRMVAPPLAPNNGILIYNRTTNLPEFVTVGSGLTIISGSLRTDGLSPAAFSGSYLDLTNTPTIPAAQVNADWNAISGVEAIQNKPTLFDGAYSSLSGTPTLFDGAWSSLTGKPTDLSAFANGPGYVTSSALSGLVSSASLSTTLGSYATSSALASGLAGKEAAGSAAVAQSYAVQRANHTGTQSVTTITSNAYVETTAKNKAIQIFKSATVASGIAVFHLTTDGSSGGTALCSEVFTDSVQVTVNDAAASFQYGWAFSNGNKTLTVTVNKFTTANILSGILGQSAANGSVAKLSISCASV